MADLRNNPNVPWGKTQADETIKTMKEYSNGQISGLKLKSFDEGYPQEFGEVIDATDRNIYTFQINDGNGSVSINEENLLDQILSTFKFTSSAPIPTINDNTNSVPDVKDVINYTVKKGWEINKYTQPNYYTDKFISITSPDYLENTATQYGTVKGLKINLSIYLNRDNFSLNQYKENIPLDSGTHDIQDAYIDSVPAVKYHDDFEMHLLIYIVIKNNYILSISFQTANQSDEDKYLGEINEFLNSVKFVTTSS